MNVAVILLAAGSSSRMGQSKQLLSIDSEPMLIKMINVSLQAGASTRVVVLGSNEEEHRNLIQNFPVEIISNPNWSSGMGSSLKAGIQHLQANAIPADAALIMVCDQPYVTSQYLQLLISKFKTSSRAIIASYYAGTSGVPVLFAKSMFNDLLNLNDEEGAKKILKQYPRHIELVDFPEGAIDLDTQEDYKTFTSQNS